MTKVAGITTQKNVRGEITHVTFNMKKHKADIAPLLDKLGVLEKTLFQKDCEGAFTVEEARTYFNNKIDSMWKK